MPWVKKYLDLICKVDVGFWHIKLLVFAFAQYSIAEHFSDSFWGPKMITCPHGIWWYSLRTVEVSSIDHPTNCKELHQFSQFSLCICQLHLTFRLNGGHVDTAFPGPSFFRKSYSTTHHSKCISSPIVDLSQSWKKLSFSAISWDPKWPPTSISPGRCHGKAIEAI